MSHEVDEKNTVQATAALVKGLHGAQVTTVEHPTDGTKAPVLMTPKAGGGFELQSLKTHIDQYRVCPEFRNGTARMATLDSFIEHVNRFQNPESAVFANNDRKTPSLMAVIDYHHRVNIDGVEGDDCSTSPFMDLGAQPEWMRHRTHYAFPLSDEWKSWTGKNGQQMEQGDFCAFIEERALDILPAPTFQGDLTKADDELRRMAQLINGRWASPEKMMGLSRGLAIFETSRVINATNINSGEGTITFEEEHADSEGKKLEVPSLFLIGIPVFLNGPPYRIPVRLRYRKQGPKIIWYFDLYRHDKVFDHAFTEAVDKTHAETGLPVFVGAPEA